MNKHTLFVIIGVTLFVGVFFIDEMTGADAAGEIEISDCEGLQDMSDDLTEDYILTGDVDCTGSGALNGGLGFQPIGNITTPFTGTFNGAGYTINGLTMSRAGENQIGLFGAVGNSGNPTGRVDNVNLTNVDITGGADVGALVGALYGVASTTSATGQVLGTTNVGGLVGAHGTDSGAGGGGGCCETVINSWADVTVSADEDTGIVGGLIGYNASGYSIIDSYAVGGIQQAGVSSPGAAGGLVGRNDGTITRSYSTGLVPYAYYAGGLIGHNSGGSVSESYTLSTIDDGVFVGGFVGFMNVGGSISQSYAHNEDGGENNVGVSGPTVGGFVGRINNGTISNSFARGSVYQDGGGDISAGFVALSFDEGVIENSYSTGLVTGTPDGVTEEQGIGGFGGQLDNSEEANDVRYSFYDTEASGVPRSCGILSVFDCDAVGAISGETTVNMKLQSTFTTDLGEDTWDFDTIWGIHPDVNDGYPYLLALFTTPEAEAEEEEVSNDAPSSRRRAGSSVVLARGSFWGTYLRSQERVAELDQNHILQLIGRIITQLRGRY